MISCEDIYIVGKFFILCIISCILNFLRVGRLYFMSYAGKDEFRFFFSKCDLCSQSRDEQFM